MSVKKYVLAKEENDVYDLSYRKRSPVLKLENDTLTYNNSTFNLEGLSLEEWIKNNPEELKHNEEDDSKPGSTEVFSVKNGFKIFEVNLDEDEDYYITIPKSNTSFFDKDFELVNEIFEDLKIIFSYVEPIDEHLDVYSNKTRELILKASTEVETHWKELLKLNGYPDSRRLNTNDYCKLLEFINFDLHLYLDTYPTEKTFKPFENWNCNQPTKSLDWYNTYNSIKHDRTNTLDQAKLETAINAVGAVYILAAIRYGEILTDRKIELKMFKKRKMIKFSRWSIKKYSNSISKNYIKYFDQ